MVSGLPRDSPIAMECGLRLVQKLFETNTRNEQFIDTKSNLVMNAVELIQIKDIMKVLLCVNGIVNAIERNDSCNEGHELVASVTFNEIVLYFNEDLETWREVLIPKRIMSMPVEESGNPSAVSSYLRIPLPSPRGSLTTTFVDDTLRISKGGKGGLFVAARCRSA